MIISNKLAWVRSELKTPEPTFEPGIWKDLQHDAVQRISYSGMLECFEQGNELLGGYIPQLVSVHDPDEYLDRATNAAEDEEYFNDIKEAYRALHDLKQQGKVLAIGVGAKNWKSIQRITNSIDLDWVMIANSMTIHSHPKELLDYMEELKAKGIQIINSAVFNAGFLIGGDYYNYKYIDPADPANAEMFQWRKEFFAVCDEYNIRPAQACVQFGLSAPGVVSIALSTSSPKRVKENVDIAYEKVPVEFWNAMKAKGLIKEYYTWLPKE